MSELGEFPGDDELPPWFAFRPEKNDPLLPELCLVARRAIEIGDPKGWGELYSVDVADPDAESGRTIHESEGGQRLRFVAALIRVATDLYACTGELDSHYSFASCATRVADAADGLLAKKVLADPSDLSVFLEALVQSLPTCYLFAYKRFVRVVEQHAACGDLTNEQKELVRLWRQALVDHSSVETRKLGVRLDAAIGQALALRLQAGDAWADAARAHCASLAPDAEEAWTALLEHVGDTKGGKPSAKWSKRALELVAPVGTDAFVARCIAWFDLFDAPRTRPHANQWQDERTPDAHTAEYAKGLAWCAGLVHEADPELARALGRLTLAALKKVPGVGPRCIKVSNAAVWALGNMEGLEGVGQLGYLASRVRGANAKKSITKAYAAAGERLGLTPDELVELGVPTYGLTEVGRGEVRLGEFVAVVEVTGTSTVELRWRKPDGKLQKSAPKAVRDAHADELKGLRASVKDLGKMLPAQRDRIDAMFLDQRVWAAPTWRERYLDHPLVGTLARRVIWTFERDGDTRAAIHHEDALRTLDGSPLEPEFESEGSVVRLWHPVTAERDDVLAWRAFLEERRITQPFKQAHREVYLLTDAERATNTYSNRFAAHVLKQHQFNALCDARNWRNKLRLGVDDAYEPAHRLLPRWNLRAEYWIEGIPTDDLGLWGSVYPLVATDQVRFYAIDAPLPYAHASGGGYSFSAEDAPESLELETVPPLVLSEVMRDVDLFVGVASVGADPNWADGGREVPHHDYWLEHAFGDLGATARTRKEILERLVPRLAIADRCSFDDKSLVVRGDRRTYRIHMGSGNIIMEPNDQYLCIVPNARSAVTKDVYLPFEGDRVLSVILSKAIMLADDTSITDPTILSQIGAG